MSSNRNVTILNIAMDMDVDNACTGPPRDTGTCEIVWNQRGLIGHFGRVLYKVSMDLLQLTFFPATNIFKAGNQTRTIFSFLFSFQNRY